MRSIKRLCMLMRYDKTEEITAGNIQVLHITGELFVSPFKQQHQLTLFFRNTKLE